MNKLRARACHAEQHFSKTGTAQWDGAKINSSGVQHCWGDQGFYAQDWVHCATGFRRWTTAVAAVLSLMQRGREPALNFLDLGRLNAVASIVRSVPVNCNESSAMAVRRAGSEQGPCRSSDSLNSRSFPRWECPCSIPTGRWDSAEWFKSSSFETNLMSASLMLPPSPSLLHSGLLDER